MEKSEIYQYEDKNPWQRRKTEEPPNIDDLLDQFSNNLFGGSGGVLFPLFLFLVLVILWAISGFYVVKPAEQAIILRFGKYYTTNGPGLHWIAPGIDNKYLVNINQIYSYNYSDQMLTEDENYVKAAITVFYRIDNPRNYLFNVIDPEETLHDAVHSALRQTIGHTHLEEILTSGKEQVRTETATLLNQVLTSYGTGIIVTDVKLQEATVPATVISAFDDVITAREAKAAKISQGERYFKKVVPLAKGKSQRIITEAQAYHDKVVLNARADVAQYLALLPQYTTNSKILSDRLYYQTLDDILERVHKVYVSDNKQVLYLPLPNAKEGTDLLKKNILPSELEEKLSDFRDSTNHSH
ncbi:MAG: FtsH protease activity modulator HflK [Pseudomonadota bacterium]|nr:FtsH protease activity modulator HflK [Pseudomonadota bacterium]